jgi:hypothetical protein
MQDKSRLGTRYTCFECGLKFYDLTRPEPLCPKCGADQRKDPNPDPRESVLARYRGKGVARRAEEELDADEEIDEDADADDEELDDDEEGADEVGDED